LFRRVRHKIQRQNRNPIDRHLVDPAMRPGKTKRCALLERPNRSAGGSANPDGQPAAADPLIRCLAHLEQRSPFGGSAPTSSASDG